MSIPLSKIVKTYEVPDFIPDHKSHPDFLVVGLSPSTKTKPFKNGTFARLLLWFAIVNLPEWDFCNVISEVNSTNIKLCDETKIRIKCANRKKIIALGNVVSRVLTKYKIPHYKIDHPSPRNRKLNDKKYELEMLNKLKVYLDGNDGVL